LANNVVHNCLANSLQMLCEVAFQVLEHCTSKPPAGNCYGTTMIELL